jgi:hypothetical protein
MAGANITAALVNFAKMRNPDPDWLRVEPGIMCFKEIQRRSVTICRNGGRISPRVVVVLR